MLLDQFDEKFPVLTSSLRKGRLSDRLAHAFILHGDSEELRERFHAALIEHLLCTSPRPDGGACGECASCKMAQNGTYPDLQTLAPTSKSRSILVGKNEEDPDTIRWFENFFYLTSATAAGVKIGVIKDADRMQPAAQNAFLKTLEEPPGKTFFILMTGNPVALLPTIRSRCQTLSLLANQCQYDFPGADELFHSLHWMQFDSNGDLAAAENCFETIHGVAKSLNSLAEETVNAEWEKRFDDLAEFDPNERKREEKRRDAAVKAEYLRLRSYFLSAVHTWFAQVYLLSQGASKAALANAEILGDLTVPAGKNWCEFAFKSLTHAEKFLDNLNWNVNEELAFRDFCLKVAREKSPS